MFLLLEEALKRAKSSLYSDQPAEIPDFTAGETVALSVALLTRIDSPVSSRLFDVQDLTGWTNLRAAVGVGYRLPIAGTFTMTTGGDTTAAIPFDATAGQIQTALNALTSVTGVGGVTVAEIADGYFSISRSTVGTWAELTGDASNLAPLSDVDCGTLIDGTGSIKEVQTFRISQSPATWVDLTLDSVTASVTVDEVQTGGSGLNAKYRVNLDPLPFDGQWTLTIGGTESGVIDFDASESALTTILEAVATVGAGNVTAKKETAGQYLITFAGDKANTDMGTITGDASGLQVIPTASGDLPLDVPGIDLLLDGAEEKAVTLAIRGTPPGGSPRILFETDATLKSTIFTSGSETPQPKDSYYKKTEADAQFVAKSQVAADLSSPNTDDPASTEAVADALTGKVTEITAGSVWGTDIVSGNRYVCLSGGTLTVINTVPMADGVQISNVGAAGSLTVHGNIDVVIAPGEFVSISFTDNGDGTWSIDTAMRVTLALLSQVTKTQVGLSNVPNTDATNASNISSGTLPFARLATGTSSSTVAVGNDSRITGAAQKTSNLSDLASVATARANLNAASRAVILDQDSTRTSTTTYTDIALAGTTFDGLSVFGQPIAANENVSFEIIMEVSDASNAQNQKYLLTVPSGAAGQWALSAVAVGGSSSVYAIGNAIGSNVVNAIATSAGGSVVHIRGVVRNGSTAGNIVLQAAQSSSSANTVTIKKGSAFKVWR